MKRLLNLLLVMAVGCSHSETPPETARPPAQADESSTTVKSNDPLAVIEELGGKTVRNEQDVIVQLDLDNTQCNDEALSHLTSWPQLQELWLDGTKITDSGPVSYTHLTLPTILLV